MTNAHHCHGVGHPGHCQDESHKPSNKTPADAYQRVVQAATGSLVEPTIEYLRALERHVRDWADRLADEVDRKERANDQKIEALEITTDTVLVSVHHRTHFSCACGSSSLSKTCDVSANAMFGCASVRRALVDGLVQVED